MTKAITDLLAILDLEKIEENLFRGRSPQVGWQRVFGGLVIAQALVAAQRTVENLIPHSLHAYFLLGGDPSVPIVYQVEHLRDGRTFATRRCQAIQHGKIIFALAASFHNPEPGLAHATPPPPAPPPESLPDESQFLATHGAQMPEPVRRYFERERPIELRPVDAGRYVFRGKQEDPVQKVWVRTSAALPDDPAIHRAALAYLSDMTLLDTSLIAHSRSVFDPEIQAASLDHALWLHRPFRADEWMLYVQDSPNAFGALGFSRGALYSRGGELIASVAQEGLIRLRRPPETPAGQT
jgi:acyl-CoA thioesterase-2